MRVDNIEIRNNIFGRRMLVFIYYSKSGDWHDLNGKTMQKYWLDMADGLRRSCTMSTGGSHLKRDRFFV